MGESEIYDYIISDDERETFYEHRFAYHRKCKYDHPQIIKCRICGEGNLFWKDTGKGWVLINTCGEYHRCFKSLIDREMDKLI